MNSAASLCPSESSRDNPKGIPAATFLAVLETNFCFSIAVTIGISSTIVGSRRGAGGSAGSRRSGSLAALEVERVRIGDLVRGRGGGVAGSSVVQILERVRPPLKGINSELLRTLNTHCFDRARY